MRAIDAAKKIPSAVKAKVDTEPRPLSFKVSIIRSISPLVRNGTVRSRPVAATINSARPANRRRYLPRSEMTFHPSHPEDDVELAVSIFPAHLVV